MVSVAFYNISMDKLSKDQIKIEKTYQIINTRMPDFSMRFFNSMEGILKPSSLYIYSIDIAAFFDYLGSTSCNIKKMNIRDLSKISPEVIEDYVEFVRSSTTNNRKKQPSDNTIHRIICILSAFFDYYFKNGFILFNPVCKVSRPSIPRNPSEGTNMQDNLKLLEYVSKGNLPTEKMSVYQSKLRARDTAILALIMGAGLKTSECLNINIQDLDLEHNCLYVRSRHAPNLIYISPFISEKLSEYLSIRLDMIAVYGHDDALFLSLRMQRLGARELQLLLKKYSSALFGDQQAIKANDLRNAFRRNIFTTSQNLFVTSAITGSATAYLLQKPYSSYLDYYETEKGKDFNPEDLLNNEGGTE